MCSALDRVLTVDEREILIAVLVGVGQRNLYIFAFEVNNRVERIDRHVLRQEVQETVLGGVFFAVIDQRKAGIEVCVVTEQFLDIIVAEMVIFEESFAVIRYELNDGSPSLGAVIIKDSCVGGQFALGELRAARFAFAEGLHGKERREGIDGFGTDTVQADRFLEGLAVVFTAGVEYRNHFHQFTQRNTASVVAHANPSVLDIHFNHFSFPHTELINGVVDTLLDKHIDTVVGVTSVA